MKEREIYLDKLRVAATCAVVLLHTVTGVMDHTDMGAYPREKTFFLVILDLICWCVPVFLLISGYLFLDPGRKLTMRQMLTKYCRRIALALFVFGVPYACLEQIVSERSFRWNMLGKAFVMVIRGESWSHLWYLYLILALYLLTPAIRRLLAVLPRRGVYLLLAFLFLGSSVLPYFARLTGREGIWTLPDWGIYVFYYICGFLFVNRRNYDLADRAPSGRPAVSLSSHALSGSPAENTAEGAPDSSGWIGSVKEARETTREKNPGRTDRSGTICSVLAVVLALGMAGSRLPGIYTVQMAYNYPFTVALSLLLFAGERGKYGSVSRKDLPGDAAWNRAAGISFTVYLIHPVFLNIAYKLFHVTPLSFSVGIALPIFYCAVLFLSCATALVLCRIPHLRDYVL